MKTKTIVFAVILAASFMVASCDLLGDKEPQTVILRIEADLGFYFAVQVDGEFIGKVLYSTSPYYPDYVELSVEVGDHPVYFAAYGSPEDYFIGVPPLEGPANIIVSVPEEGTSIMISNPRNYPVF